MSIKTLCLCLTLFSLASCASTPKVTHPEFGTVRTDNTVYVAQRDECLVEYLSSQEATSEAETEEGAVQITSVLSKNLAAAMEVSNALSSNGEAMAYADECLEKKGWQKSS